MTLEGIGKQLEGQVQLIQLMQVVQCLPGTFLNSEDIQVFGKGVCMFLRPGKHSRLGARAQKPD